MLSCHPNIVNSTSEAFFNAWCALLDHMVIEDTLTDYDVTMEYGSEGIHTIFSNAMPSQAQLCMLHTEVTQKLDPYLGYFTNCNGMLVVDKQRTKKGFMRHKMGQPRHRWCGVVRKMTPPGR